MGKLGIALATALFAQVASAQNAPPAPPPDVRAVFDDGTLIQLETRWDRGARVKIGDKKAARLIRGASAGTLAVGHGRVIAAFTTDDAKRPFRVHVLGANGAKHRITRPTKRRDIPFAVVATATADGFAIFFQEVQADDPTAAHTYLVVLDKSGKPGAAKKVAVPWALADAIDNGDGYHLALFYPGDARGMRLSMVQLTSDGRPRQHPDWASAAGFIADVHLVRSGESIRAYYRGGSGGDRLLESDVTAIGQWGREPAKAKDHGRLPMSRAIAIRDGKPRKVRKLR